MIISLGVGAFHLEVHTFRTNWFVWHETRFMPYKRETDDQVEFGGF